jgi:hypothetical protein
LADPPPETFVNQNTEHAAWRPAADTVADLSFEQYRRLLIHETPEIKGFLAETRAEHFIISAPKGFGKTLLLIAKRMQLNEHSSELDRGGEIVDRPPGTFTDVGRNRMNEYKSDFDLWCRIWTYSVKVAAINVHARSASGRAPAVDAAADSALPLDAWTKGLMNQSDHFRSPALIFTALLDVDYTTRQKALNSYNKVSVIFARIQSQVAFFIDNVDEYFAPALENNSMASALRGVDDDQQKSNQIWINAQLALAVTAFQVHRSNHHVRVYCTIRREAFLRMREQAVEYQQILGSTVEIKYGRSDLEQIFRKNVSLMARDSVFRQESDPVAMFFGPAKSIRHPLVDRSESAFNFVLRHTFYRPRDLMSICGSIALVPPEERTPARIKEVVDEESGHLVHGVFSQMKPFFDLPDLDLLLASVRRNVSTSADLEQACAAYIRKVEQKFDVDEADLKTSYLHPFCTLYQIGMLGWIQADPRESQADAQRFLKPRDVEVGLSPGLPPTDRFYLIHPALDRMIADRVGREYYRQYHRANILGADLPWAEPAASLFVIKGDLCGFSRIMNTEFYETIALRLHDWTRASCGELDFVEVSGGDSIVMIDRSPDKVLDSMFQLLSRVEAYREQPLTFRFGGSAGPITFKPLQRRISNTWEGICVPLGLALRASARLEPYAPKGRLIVDAAFVDGAGSRLEKFRFEEMGPDDLPSLMYDSQTKIFSVQKSTTDPIYQTRLYAVSAAGVP